MNKHKKMSWPFNLLLNVAVVVGNLKLGVSTGRRVQAVEVGLL